MGLTKNLSKLLEPLITVRRVLPLLWVSARGWSVLATILIVVEVTFGLLTLYLVKQLVDVISSLLGVDGQAADVRAVLVHVGWFGAATLAYLVARGVANLARETQGMAVADYVDHMIHARAVNADLAFYESPRYFDTLHRARQSGSQRPAQITSNILLLGKNAVMLVAVIFLLASINWMLLPILAFAILPALVIRIHFTRRLYDWQRQRTQLERRASYLDWLMTSEIHAKELRLNQLGDDLQARYSKIRTRIRGERFQISRRRTFVELAVAAVATSVFFAALAYLAFLTAEGRNTVGDLVLFLLVFQRAQSMGQEIVSQISRLYEDHLFISLLFEFLDLKPKIFSPPQPEPSPDRTERGIVMNNVTFAYPGCKDAVLRNINLEIRPGQVVALVGSNGSGKTSLIKLLTRLYDPTAGEILVDGRDARTFDLREYRRLFGVIFQDFSQYSDTVRENIRFGDVRLPAEASDVENAARQAGAEKFINGLAKKYDTLLGRMFEGGQQISLGQWQKIALARAFINRSSIVILDEPTSALDPNAEYELFENFRERIGARSALVISHRLSTIRMADYIYVLDSGRIVEAGQHHELMKIDGLYCQAFSQQGKHYREASRSIGAC